ncbi:hypothetical protein [Stutzerimonas azotifigens]|uniref:hypothetical protein n=1 Tax=Stutzerimonas azotifigens TaxID=291995 RepID=UPI0003F8F740|nr:hypothetical protein [Stutzerimonas azotifigens]
MIRVRGRIGEWSVDLQVELEAQDWQRVAEQLSVAGTRSAAAEPPPSPQEPLWQAAQQLLRDLGEMEGPALLAQLRALAGGDQGAKRLLVRLRHSAAVTVSQGEGAPLFRWVGYPDRQGPD